MKLNLRLTEAIRSEPFIITHLVRISILQLTLQPVWEGLAAHKWSGKQLEDLDSALAGFNFPADYKFSVGGERTMHVKVLDWLEQNRSRYWHLAGVFDSDALNDFYVTAEIYLMPKGWFYQSELIIAKMDQQWILPAADVAQQIMSPQLIQQAQTNIDSTKYSGAVGLFTRLLVPSLGRYALHAAFGQASVDLARTAIALERYHLAHGEFPDSLDALAPQFIANVPHDVIGGQPLHYRRTNDGQFVLYSVGWNQTDDGGKTVFTKGSSPTVNLDEGDWVWEYPPK